MNNTLKEYKCPCCDGGITFDTGSQKMKCPFCGTEFDVETLVTYDEDLSLDGDSEMNWEDSKTSEWQENEAEGICTYVCNSCGGEVVGDSNMAATSCPYCANPIVVTGKVSGILKPDYVIPFKVDKKSAVNALKQFYNGKKLLPKVFKDENHIEEVKGVYVPFWLFDADVDANVRYKATRVRMWSDSRYDYCETSYYSVIRAGNAGFENVPVDGSQKMDDELMESIEPFDFSDAVDFQTAYLSGFFADKYDIDSEKSIERANERIEKSVLETFASTVVGYSSVVPVADNIQLKDGVTKYSLFPVWLLNTEWNGEKYTFAVNGQTGKVAGDLPMDKSAYLKWLFGLALGIGIAVFALLRILGMM